MSGYSKAIGDSLRQNIIKRGGRLVSSDLVKKLIRQKGYSESDLNYRTDQLKNLLPQLNADAVIYGHVFTSDNIISVELRYLESGVDTPRLYPPIICGNLRDVFESTKDMAEIVMTQDKDAPTVLSIEPSGGSEGIEQYVELKITFSEPMNPSTFSLSGKPETMWKRYGDVKYDELTNTFTINLHLYPKIEYEFCINGEDGVGFKDVSGNPAAEYRWEYITKPW
jgi:hypothetical protein